MLDVVPYSRTAFDRSFEEIRDTMMMLSYYSLVVIKLCVCEDVESKDASSQSTLKEA
jgi:hypothetical protein